MKHFSLYILVIFICLRSFAQQRIHAHNDYQRSEPLMNALRYKVFSIEADIYLCNNKLVVFMGTCLLKG